MAPTILVVGATGNTGKNVIHNLPKLIQSSSNYRILGLTRSLNNPVSQELAAIPQVEMQEKDWTTIDANWLKEQEVVRVFIAPHNLPHQFLDESAFYVAALEAGIEYLVKISTSEHFIGPASPVFYGRAHWAIEKMLSQPEYDGLKWTSLRPNVFTTAYLTTVVDWIKNYRKNGTKDHLKLVMGADTPVALVDPDDVGTVAAVLLTLEDPSPHNRAMYVINGPEDINGKKIVEAIEEISGAKVQDVEYKNTSIFSSFGKLYASIYAATEIVWSGQFGLTASPTSEEVIKLARPETNLVDSLKKMLLE
ncbi:uncharacterized protein EV154DRAFT_457840 [Mucor mucedo]|uniref:uncharacterized protein n=1 Tax=Mucor mucedo TaxID=29922 RepID=UPI00221EA2CC|nr:uncharacterized protein EV154DRAFT_457840 [Mucor mucedo]KAI7895313.1 hypothetical protein EV154DRAFT_457840 [Mucor mucedo]